MSPRFRLVPMPGAGDCSVCNLVSEEAGSREVSDVGKSWNSILNKPRWSSWDISHEVDHHRALWPAAVVLPLCKTEGL
jgi:hypothetical protein